MNSKSKQITIAILPFQILTEEARIENLFLGFTEDLIINLSKFIGLSVISSYSTFRIKDLTDQKEINSLGADYLVFGTVRPLNNLLRITIQLIKSDDKSLVYAGQHNESLNALVETQDDIVREIVMVLQEKIETHLLSHSYQKESVHLLAYENYLLGMNTLKSGTAQSDIEARKYFNKALEIDPQYSLAYSGISLSYFNFWSCLLYDRWDASMKGALKYGLKAKELNPNDYLALGILGRVYVYKGEYDLAEHCLRKSLRMNMNDTANLLRVSFSLMYLGYAKEAAALYEKALVLNPFHQDYYYGYGSNYYLHTGEFEKSIELGKKAPVDSWTDYPAWIAAAYLQVKDEGMVWKYWEHYLELFKKIVYTGKKSLEEEALEWLITLNPFKGFTYLYPLVDFIRENKNLPVKKPADIQKVSQKPSFIEDGEVWEMNYSGNSAVLKSVKGFHDLTKLLAEPHKKFHCLDLMGAAVDETFTAQSIDQKAKAQYQNRIKSLQAEIEEAEELNQTEYIEKLREEYDGILDHLSKSMGLSGKSRKVGSTLEKARSAVTWRIRTAIKKIEEKHPEAGSHLARCIKTGTHCSYEPDSEIDWVL